MKQFLTIILLFLGTLSFGQTVDTTKTKLSGYLSYGLSMANSTDFRASSYTGIEGGVMYDNIGVGVVFGRATLQGLGRRTDNINEYFYEVKTSASFPIGKLSGSVILGYGGYFGSSRNFIEYGGGITYNVNKFGYGVSCTNWGGIAYITPSITFNF